MNYPVWDLGFAHGLLIAGIAILHVYISHFAVGGGLYLVVTETVARRRGDEKLLGVVHGHARFFILVTLVLGAITGVGIWFTIGLINPAGTSALIRAFVWGWAIEWVFFITEIAAAMVYYYGWNRLSAKSHLAVGWVYFVAAWLSMVIINGILTFQLTPGQWIETRGFWDGFFNPTYWPSLVARTLFSIALAGLFALLTAARIQDTSLRTRLVRYNGVWALVGIAGSTLASVWWWGSVPEVLRELTAGNMPFASLVADRIPLAMGILALLIVAGPLLMPRVLRAPAAWVILIVGFVVMGSGEWIREAIRKPWVIVDYMYSNGMRRDQIEDLRGDGFVANARWIGDPTTMSEEELGERLFLLGCGNCHSRSGYNGMEQRVRDWEESQTAGMIQRIEYMRRPMPPWMGNESEANAMAAYLHSLLPPGAAARPVLTDGEAVYRRSCSSCHSIDGFQALQPLVEGLEAADLDEYMQDMESDQMPAFSGTDEERRVLAEWLAQIGAGSTETSVSALDSRPEGGAR